MSIRRRRCLAALALALVPMALVAACSAREQSTGEPVAAVQDVDPCALLSPDEIRDVTGWTVPAGVDESELLDGDRVQVCSFTEPDHAGLVQVQVDDGAGSTGFERARAELEAQGMGGSDVRVRGAQRAVENEAHGVVGMLVGDTFVRVVVIGPGVDDEHHLRLAEVVAGNLA